MLSPSGGSAPWARRGLIGADNPEGLGDVGRHFGSNAVQGQAPRELVRVHAEVPGNLRSGIREGLAPPPEVFKGLLFPATPGARAGLQQAGCPQGMGRPEAPALDAQKVTLLLSCEGATDSRGMPQSMQSLWL